jgi:Domain of unknown function (DUF4404)
VAEESLRELLARVHERLNAGGAAVDTEARELLGTVMSDIERTLGAARAPAGSAADVAAHVPRLEELAVEFQAAHPGLSATLRQLIDALGKAGI